MLVPYVPGKTYIPRLPVSINYKWKRRTLYHNEVISFDTETTTFFETSPGIYTSEKYTTPQQRESAISTIAIVYLWGFRVGDIKYFGRTREDLIKFINEFSKVNPERKHIFIHNLNFDFCFVNDIFNIDYTDRDPLIARAKHAPLRIVCENAYILHDSLALCNMSLAKVGKTYNLTQKLKGNVDYTEARTPNTILTPKEYEYFEHDLDIVYEYIKQEWLSQNYNLETMPITQTGVPRSQVKKILNDRNYLRHQRAMSPKSIEEYKMLREVFAGGVSHANFMYTTTDNNRKTVHNVTSCDRASSYPTEIVTRKFPNSRPVRVNAFDENDDYGYILLVKYQNLRAITAWDYISYSKCHDQPINAIVDNGRVAAAESLTIRITNIDYQIIKSVYEYDNIEFLEIHRYEMDYLPLPFVQYVLELYNNKTKLKRSDPALYMRSKQILNSIYGMTVTDIVRENIIFKDGDYFSEYEFMDEDQIAESMNKKLADDRPVIPYAMGIFVTAYARQALYEPIIHENPDGTFEGIANDAIYTDTDSIKFINADKNMKYIDLYNDKMLKRLHDTAKARNLPYELFAPLDPDGNPHPLGVFENETKSFATEFMTMGAKKYCYKTADGVFHYVIAGLQKSYIDQNGEHDTMHDFDDFTVDKSIANGRTNYRYDNEQPLGVVLTDYQGTTYRNEYRRGVSMWRTSYTFSLSTSYEDFLTSELITEFEQHNYNAITSPFAVMNQWGHNDETSKNSKIETA